MSDIQPKQKFSRVAESCGYSSTGIRIKVSSTSMGLSQGESLANLDLLCANNPTFALSPSQWKLNFSAATTHMRTTFEHSPMWRRRLANRPSVHSFLYGRRRAQNYKIYFKHWNANEWVAVVGEATQTKSSAKVELICDCGNWKCEKWFPHAARCDHYDDDDVAWLPEKKQEKFTPAPFRERFSRKVDVSWTY